MALEYAHGAIQWLAADTVGTNYTVSGLSFQPKGIRFWCVGLQNAADAVSEAVDQILSVGFATGTADRRCVGAYSDDTAATSNCSTSARNDAVLVSSDGTGTDNGLLDIDQLNSDGFRLRVDDQGVANITVFWECWGGADITVAATFDLAEPAATGNVDVTVTGFVSSDTDQVVLFAGVQNSNALNTGLAEASGLFVGAAKDASNQWVCGGNADDASAAMDTDGWCLDGECIGMIARAGAATVEARAAFVQYNTDGFRVNYAARAVTGRKTVGLAMKGGQWAVGSYTINGNTGSATATVSGLDFAPKGVSLAGRMTTEQASNVATANNRLGIGCGSSTSSRRSMGVLDEDATASSACEINTTIQYDQVLCFPSTAGALQSAYDINAMNSDGFQIIVDTAGGVASEWQGYVTFGDAPAIEETDADADGAATVTGQAAGVGTSVGDSDGAATVTGVSGATKLSEGDSDGVATVTGVSGATKVVEGDSDGVATVAGAGATIKATRVEGWFEQAKALGTSSNVSSFPLAFDNDNKLHGLLIAYLRYGNAAASVTITDSQGNTWVRIRTAIAGGGATRSDMWYAENCAAGPNTITVTPDAATTITLAIAEYGGAIFSGSLDAENGHQSNGASAGTDAVTSGAFNVTKDRALIICGLNQSTSAAGYATVAPGTGFTERVVADADGLFGQVRLEDDLEGNVAGSDAGTWTFTVNFPNHGVMAAAFKVAVGPEGVATVSGQTAAVKGTEGDSDAVATATGVSGATKGAEGDSDGVATVSGQTSAVKQTEGDSDGVATVSGQSGATKGVAGGAAGQATVSGSTARIDTTDGDADGSATVSGVSGKIAGTQAQAAGAATVDGQAEDAGAGAEGETDAQAAGSATVSGQAAAVAATEGDADGAATVTGVSAATKGAEGDADGAATVDGQSGKIAGAQAQAAGVATVSGEGQAMGAATHSTTGIVIVAEAFVTIGRLESNVSIGRLEAPVTISKLESLAQMELLEA